MHRRGSMQRGKPSGPRLTVIIDRTGQEPQKQCVIGKKNNFHSKICGNLCNLWLKVFVFGMAELSTSSGSFMRLLACLLIIFAAAESFAAETQKGDFATCVSGLEKRALNQGLDRSLVRDILGAVEFQPRVIELDRDQPEFRQSFSAYLRARVSEVRVNRGRELLVRHRSLLEKLARDYGVPGHYLISIWGMETNFGSYLGNMPTLDSLATLACDPRRSEFFTNELISALKLLAREGLAPETMRGSWAGAMGHTQFMPSAYIRHAVDGDGDGNIDLWESEVDALTSAANYLANLGWQRGQRWGREVLLPADFPYARTGLVHSAPLAQWRELGVRRTDGRPLPAADIHGAVIVPMGHRGPAFLVYDNFEVIMKWNRSQAYAIAVGHLADRIAGGGQLRAALPRVETAPSRSQVELLQDKLITQGFDPGEVDGAMGPATRAALRAFQQARGLVADGYPGPDTLEVLNAGTPASQQQDNG